MASKPDLSCQTEMDILGRVVAKVGQYLELDKVLETALSEIFTALKIKNGCVYLLDRQTGTLTIQTQRHLSKRFLKTKSTIRVGEGCAGTAVVTKEMFAPTSAERDYVCKESEEMLGLDCLAAIPIVAQDEVLGVLELFAPVARRLDGHERDLIEAINNQLAVAIKNASIHSSLQHALDNTKKLLQATETITATLEFDTILEYLARLACELTRVSRAAIAFYDSKAKELEFVVSSSERIPKGTRLPVIGRALTTVYEKGRAVAVTDLAELTETSRERLEQDNVRSILIVPLRFAGRTLGALYLDEPYFRHYFTPLEIELAEGIARHTAAAIQNARSFESTQKALANAEALLEAAEMVATILEPDILLKQLARLAPKLTGISRAGIWLFDGETEELSMEIAPTPQMPAHVRCKIKDGPLRTVLYQGKILTVTDLSTLPDPMCWLMRRQNIKALLLAPLHYGSEIIGILMLYDDNRPHDFSNDEISMAEAISHHAAIGVVNARSFAEQRRIAETLQQGFVPSRPPLIPTIKFGVSYRSASESAFVGGDFYDFIQTNGLLALCVGDVSGRGIEAASLAGLAKSTIRAYALDHSDPEFVLKMTNKLIATQTTGHQFITLEYGVLDVKERAFTHISAGHPPPLLIHDARGDFLTVAGALPIGVDEGAAYKQQSVSLPKNSFLVFYTDGLIEARQGGVLFGLEGLLKTAIRHSAGDPQELVDGILGDVEAYSEHKLVDDIAVVALHIA